MPLAMKENLLIDHITAVNAAIAQDSHPAVPHDFRNF